MKNNSDLQSIKRQEPRIAYILDMCLDPKQNFLLIVCNKAKTKNHIFWPEVYISNFCIDELDAKIIPITNSELIKVREKATGTT